MRLLLEYDGTDFAGYQRQPGRRTVQGELEKCLARIAGERVKTVAAGRTDAGVHAVGQVVNFHTSGSIPVERIVRAANSVLPRDVAVKAAEEVPEGFHARFSARSRVYRYTVVESRSRLALLGRYAYVVYDKIDDAAMREASAVLVGVHDFSAYALKDDGAAVRDVKRLEVVRRGRMVEITIEANAFLRSMARFIVSALLGVGAGRLDREDLERMLATGERHVALQPAPPQGLCLVRVNY
ncbi:MAG: tRNA pseudouridine(38-40) synthase TruA [Armatimonadota bacterium]